MKSHLARLVPAVERELGAARERREHQRVAAERERLMAEMEATLADVKR